MFLSISLTRSLLSSTLEAASPPLDGIEAVEQPNTKQVRRAAAESVTGEAWRVLCEGEHGGFREG